MSAKVSIAARCRALFPTSVRLRGEAQMRDRHLILGKQGATTLSGGIAGANTGDACRIDWLNAEQGRIGMRCGCPAFIADGPCEHLWALLLLADEQNLGAAIAGVGRLVGHDLTDLVIDDETAGNVLANGFLANGSVSTAPAHQQALTPKPIHAVLLAPRPRWHRPQKPYTYCTAKRHPPACHASGRSGMC